MRERSLHFGAAVKAACLVGVVLMGVGCPLLMNLLNGKAKVTVLLTTGSDASKGVVPVDDLASLTVTVTEISLVPLGGEAEEKADGPVVVFQGELDVNLMDLTGVSEVLSSGEAPAGTYEQIRLAISNPRLALASDPGTELTNIHLTANGQLFISQEFELPAGQSSLISLDFGGIHLVQQGNGDYTLTPQLTVDLEVTSADVVATGSILALDTAAKTLTLGLVEGELQVAYGSAVIFLATDTDTPTGTEADLAVGLNVEVTGTMQVDGSVVADSIRILP